ncbi:NAD(P)H-quinone oxidoreductase subunit 5 chloroplastic [Phtheirospermum japonicum]|uniref:NAD(P)H-quinone oxidoreductase subunit 5 chloroplastic n=1 Tax=Phtheirospermum japonicum TaxID=374723 RepID=A0A830BYX7_9LAMI|nr:NAD(P)H-quinone oxidoreductase subunit 5 chloroplastic [Phtheirospermum japonicum]
MKSILLLLLCVIFYYLPVQSPNLHNFPFMYGYLMLWRDPLLFRPIEMKSLG